MFSVDWLFVWELFSNFFITFSSLILFFPIEAAVEVTWLTDDNRYHPTSSPFGAAFVSSSWSIFCCHPCSFCPDPFWACLPPPLKVAGSLCGCVCDLGLQLQLSPLYSRQGRHLVTCQLCKFCRRVWKWFSFPVKTPYTKFAYLLSRSFKTECVGLIDNFAWEHNVLSARWLVFELYFEKGIKFKP